MHVSAVQRYIFRLVTELTYRADTHDASKLQEPELTFYATTIPNLAGLKYGTPEHKAVLAQMKPAIKHHQKVNRHHPEHYENGIAGMNLVDLCEIVADWKAASIRSGDDFKKSLDISAKRFNLDPQLLSIIMNTAELFE